ncbi:hypothetical protein ACFYT4_22135 [Streptomyces sp. NPDC004609]|uniref:hypothetical protein n=1 Tax=Streptomyces sp. NPDC004609 TaxID=3364704 RepID=UPI0036C7E313
MSVAMSVTVVRISATSRSLRPKCLRASRYSAKSDPAPSDGCPMGVRAYKWARSS